MVWASLRIRNLIFMVKAYLMKLSLYPVTRTIHNSTPNDVVTQW